MGKALTQFCTCFLGTRPLPEVRKHTFKVLFNQAVVQFCCEGKRCHPRVLISVIPHQPQCSINLILALEKFGNAIISELKYSPVFREIKRGHLLSCIQS